MTKKNKVEQVLLLIAGIILVLYNLVPIFIFICPGELMLGFYIFVWGNILWHLFKIKNKLLPFLLVSAIMLGAFTIVDVAMSEKKDWLIVYRMMISLTPLFYSYVAVKKLDSKFLKPLVVSMFACFVVTLVTTLIGNVKFPLISRHFVSGTTSAYNTFGKEFEYWNIGGFGFVYNSVAMIALLIYLRKKKKISFWFLLFVLLLEGCLLYCAQYLIAICGFLVIFPLAFFPYKSKKSIISYGVLMITMVSILLIVIANFAPQIIENMEASNLKRKLADIHTLLTTGKIVGTVKGRVDVYMKSIDLIIKYPIFGSRFVRGAALNGEHSFTLDTIANYGLIGLGVLIIFYYCIWKMLNLYKDKKHVDILVVLFVLCIFIASINTDKYVFTLAFAFPLVSEGLERKILDHKEIAENAYIVNLSNENNIPNYNLMTMFVEYFVMNKGMVFIPNENKGVIKYIKVSNMDEIRRISSENNNEFDEEKVIHKCIKFLKSGRKILFIGKPDQISALIKSLGQSYRNLTTLVIDDELSSDGDLIINEKAYNSIHEKLFKIVAKTSNGQKLLDEMVFANKLFKLKKKHVSLLDNKCKLFMNIRNSYVKLIVNNKVKSIKA